MKTTEIPSSVRRLVKRQRTLIGDAIYRINAAKISKFDRIQFRRALDKGPEKQREVSEEISQKILGPEFHTKAIRVNFGMLRELAELGLQRYAMYHQLVQPDVQRMFVALQLKVFDLLKDLDDLDFDR